MSVDLDHEALKHIESTLEFRDTEELLDIWRTEARREWSSVGLRAIGNVLTRRLGALPTPTETDEERRSRARRFLEQARTSEKANRLREALKHAQEAVHIAPEMAEAYTFLGLHWDSRGDLLGAIRSYRQALRLDPQQEEARDNLIEAERERRELAQQGYGVEAPEEVWEAEVGGYEEEVPDWVYLDGPALNCPGRPGHRTRMGRGGLDPMDTYCEEAYMVGLWLRQLLTLTLRLRNPIYGVAGLIIGGLASLPLVFTMAELPGDSYTVARLALTSIYWVPGVLLLGNVVLSFVRQSNDPE